LSTPTLDYGTVVSITSTDSEFTNDKFATVSTATERTVTVRVTIPPDFNNSSDGYIDCDKTITQPAVSCSGGPTTNGSIPSQTLDVDGDSETIDLTSYFTAGSDPIAGYNIYNANEALVGASVSGDDLTIHSNAIGGSTNLQVSAYDNGSGTCTATQTISVTVNAPVGENFTCDIANLSGGSIAQDGTITKPDSVARVGDIKSTSGGSTITSYSANNTGSDRDVTLYFDLDIPAGYSNSGTIECSKTFSQPSSDPEFTCELANLSGQQISTKGQINIGKVQLGTIDSFSPLSFSEVDVDTARDVTFTITIPSGYSNTGTIDCTKTITQPAEIPVCGSNTYKISAPKVSAGDFCDNLYSVSSPVSSNATSITTALGKTVCRVGAPFDGKDFYYAVSENIVNIGKGTGKFYVWQIDSFGVIQDVALRDCPTDGSDNGTGRGNSL
jgi:hypothetical protein